MWNFFAGGDKSQVGGAISNGNDLPPSPTHYLATHSQQSFDWESYLKETNSEAAPQHCFKQVRLNVYVIGHRTR